MNKILSHRLARQKTGTRLLESFEDRFSIVWILSLLIFLLLVSIDFYHKYKYRISCENLGGTVIFPSRGYMCWKSGDGFINAKNNLTETLDFLEDYKRQSYD